MNIGHSNKTQHISWKKGKWELLFIIYNELYAIACNDHIKTEGVRPIIRQSDSPTNALFLWKLTL
jgi:hypothetical protein